MAERTVAVVDGNSLLHRAFHGLPPTMTAPDGRPTNAAFGFLQMLFKMAADLRPDGVVVAFDLGRPAFRTEALEQYKVHRPPAAEELKVQFPMVKKLLGALAVPVVELQGWEGDDILGTLAERGKGAGIRILLVTGDKDALQLVDDLVSVVSTRKGITDIVVYDREGVRESTGVWPEQIADYLGLKGDASDNIPGVKGVGEKTAAKLIAEHGTLDAVLEAAADIPGKLGENLREHADAARASRLVATIRRDVPVDVDLEAVRWGAWRAEDVTAAFGELRFTSLLSRVRDAAMPARPQARDATPSADVGDASGAASGIDALGGVEIVEEVTEAPEAAACAELPVLEGADALARVRAWAGAGAGPLGLAAVEDGGGSLFSEAAGLAVAGPDSVAVVREDAGDALAAALGGAAVCAAGDVKALAGALGADADALEPARLFDCGVAAYLLESNRSSYELTPLYADHVGGLPPSCDPAAASDAQAAAALAGVLGRKLEEDGSADVFHRIEMPLVPVLLRMERLGIALDAGVLTALSAETAAGIDALRAEILELAGCEFTIDSPKQLGEVLFEKLGLPKGKRTKTGWSTDASVLGELREAFPVAGKVLDYRELTKLKSTYIDALPRLVGDDGRVHTTFNQTVAATGRLSSSNPNLQNIPVRSELGRRIRAAFVPARAGDVIVSADYSQIELRVLAHLTEDLGLIDAFTSGADFHAATAARVFGVTPGDVTPEQRRRAKAVNFGIVYGQSAHGLAQTLGIGNAEAKEMIDRYFAAYPGVRAFLDATVAEAHRTGYAVTMFGRKRRIPELLSPNHNLRAFGERTAMNHPMQGTGADIMKLAMIEADRRLRASGLDAGMVLQVHDELVFEAPAGAAEAVAELARAAMSEVAELAVPLVVDVAWGPDWASAK